MLLFYVRESTIESEGKWQLTTYSTEYKQSRAAGALDIRQEARKDLH